MTGEIYFGTPGALIELPHPRGGIQTTRVRPSAVFGTASGGSRFSKTIQGKRRFTLNYEQLWYDTAQAIEAYDQGHNGPGPFVLHDPGRINWLTVNQSAATSHTNDTTDFSLATTTTPLNDNFTRSVSGSWGTASPTGGAWSNVGGFPGAYFTSSNEGFQQNSATNSMLMCSQDVASTDCELDCATRMNYNSATGAAINQYICVRFTDINNFYYARLTLSAGTPVLNLYLYKRVSGIDSLLDGPYQLTSTHLSNQYWRVAIRAEGTTISAKGWQDGTSEPTSFQVTATDFSLSSGTAIALGSLFDTGNTDAIKNTRFDNVVVDTITSTLASTSVQINRGPRSLLWTFNGTGGTPVLTLDSPTSDWFGIPVIANQPVVFSFYVRGGGSDPIATLTPQIRWLDIAGATLSTTSGSTVVSSSGAFAQGFVTATPPANAVYALCKVEATSGVSIGTVLYLDSFQLERGSTPSSWRPGTGILPVAIVSLQEQWPWQAATFRDSPTLVLQELGR